MEKIPVAVLVSGSGSNLQALIEAQTQQNVHYSIKIVVSNDPSAYALSRAQSAGISTAVLDHKQYPSREHFDTALLKVIEASGVQFVVLAGFMRRLTPNFVRHFAGRMINIHPSLLPKHPGLNTHKKALAAGDLVHGCSMHYVTEVLDGGPVIAQFSLAIAEDDDELGLRHRVLVLEHYWYWRVLNQVVLGQVVLVQGEVLYQGEPDLDSAAQFFCG